MMNDEKIFQYLGKDENTIFTKLEKDELFHIVDLINNYFLDYREKLFLDKNVSFGVELEVDETTVKTISDLIVPIMDGWGVVPEITVKKGAEVTSSILKDNLKSWNDLKTVCEILSQNSQISYDCSSHLHVGVDYFGEDLEVWLKFLQLWSGYENILYRFGYGEDLTERGMIGFFALPFANNINEVLHKNSFSKDNLLDLLNYFVLSKNQAVNFKNIKNFNNKSYKNTIEFRFFNGTYDQTIIQNNINTITKIIKSVKSSNFDIEKVENRRKLNPVFMDLLDYREIYLDQAIEFCDLIFDNNLDKIYFLRQYLKDNEVGFYKNEKAKQFTKTFTRGLK